ncbi:hypothetical protein JD844_025884 [Phrynosoma platyrhinos]|uniref:Myb/SANT-like DNA-binding domain-containing protein n=1 Tax=Phrynosoma platyrhinos TaxID=52577 RepID=A0ABQ7T0W9_PHRPL|nr:hypothetical protein JD844_025884 [Phrynosoma platyrhinos]
MSEKNSHKPCREVFFQGDKCSEMAAQRGSRRHWTPVAIMALIMEVDRSPGHAILIATRRRPNMQVWVAVQSGMAQRGYYWQVPQLKYQWSRLKSAFHKEREYREQHGTPSANPPAFYELMFRIWERPDLGGGLQRGLQNPRLWTPHSQSHTVLLHRCLQIVRRHNVQMRRKLAEMSRHLSATQRELYQVFTRP